MSLETTPVDYRQLMKKVEQVVDVIERGDEETATIHQVADEIIRRLRDDLGIQVIERDIARDELWIADEVFMCGTAAEVTPVREIDDRQIGIGARGAITKKVQDRYFEVVRGVRPPRPEWLTYV